MIEKPNMCPCDHIDNFSGCDLAWDKHGTFLCYKCI